MDLQPIISWAAPIIASVMTTVLTTILVSRINKRLENADRKLEAEKADADAERKERAEWRSRVEQRLDRQDETTKTILEAQCTQMRSDITHKIHRYMDDLHCASSEEKQSLWAEYEVYCEVCSEYKIENHFVEQMVRQVMDLPDRQTSQF